LGPYLARLARFCKSYKILAIKGPFYLKDKIYLARYILQVLQDVSGLASKMVLLLQESCTILQDSQNIASLARFLQDKDPFFLQDKIYFARCFLLGFIFER